jgi:hypothetical protein
MLQSLLAKAKATTKRHWKIFLGVFIGLLVVFVAWRMKKMRDKIARLEAEKALFEEHVKDIKVRAENDTDEAVARGLRWEASLLEGGVEERGYQIAELKKDVALAQKAVDDATTWQELERLAKGGSK